MLVEDQRALDGLLFGRWLADRLRREEFGSLWVRHDWPPYHFTPLNRSASGVEEFLAICRAERAVAEQHLRSGYFEPWLQDIGRADLASLAARLRSAGLDHFLSATAVPAGAS